MMDYQNAAQTFDLESIAKQMLSGSLDALNACYECCDRHADGDKIALYWQGKDGRKEQYTFRELKEWSSQFANFLKSQGKSRRPYFRSITKNTRIDRDYFCSLANWCCLSTTIYCIWPKSD